METTTKDKIIGFVKDKNNWKIMVGAGLMLLGAFLHAGVPALMFVAGLIVVASTDA